MQILFPILAEALSTPEEISRVRELITNNLPFVAFSQLLALVAYWISSIVIARKHSHFLNAVKVWALYLVGFLLIGALAAAAGAIGERLQSGALLFSMKVVGTMLVFMVAFVMPMAVYHLEFAKGLAFVVLSMLLNTAGLLGANRFLGSPIDVASFGARIMELLPAPMPKKIIVVEVGRPPERASSPDEKIADDPSKSVEDRFAAVQRIYSELEARRTKIDSNDQAALAAYEQSQKRYQELLRAVQNAASAAPATK